MLAPGTVAQVMTANADPQAVLKAQHIALYENIARHIGFDLHGIGFLTPQSEDYGLGLMVTPALNHVIYVRDANAAPQVSLWISQSCQGDSRFLIGAHNIRLTITSTDEGQFDASIVNTFGYTCALSKKLNGQQLRGVIKQFVATNGNASLIVAFRDKVADLKQNGLKLVAQ